MKKRIKVVGTGCQAPYGIGEIIEDFAATEAGARKALRYAERWYNRPRVVYCGAIINWAERWEGDDSTTFSA